MPNLPNPFESGEPVAPSLGEAVALTRSNAPGATAEIPGPPSSTGGCQEASTPTSTVIVAAGDVDATDCIGEIFAGARKMFEPDPAAYTRADEVYYDLLRAMDNPQTADLIEMPYGMEGIFDPAPLFLRRA